MRPNNPNFRVYARLKPTENQARTLEYTSESIIIKDIHGKTNSEKQTFNFNSIWDSNTSQETIFQNLCDNSISKLLDGTSSTVLSYGQTGSGKSFTIFGEDDRFSLSSTGNFAYRVDKRGLVPRTVEYLLKKANEFQNERELIITCNFFEIFLDQVRDLGKSYPETKGIYLLIIILKC